MNSQIARLLPFVAVAFMFDAPTFAGLIVFADKSAFLAQTGASTATTIPLTPPTTFPLNSGFTSGDLSFTLVAPDSFRFSIDDLSSRLSGNELAISGPESFNIDVDTGTVFSFGFDFVEPELDPNLGGTFVESTFGVTLKNGASTVGTFSFARPNDTAQFVGVWTGPSEAFDGIEIRETTGALENEFFGQFYTGTTAIPEPSPLAILPIGAIPFAAYVWYRRRMSPFVCPDLAGFRSGSNNRLIAPEELRRFS